MQFPPARTMKPFDTAILADRTAGIGARVGSQPQTGAEHVSAVQLEHAWRRLTASLATEKRRVVREDPDACCCFCEPVAQWLRHADFGFERSSVASHIDEMRGFILSGWRNEGQARADDRVRCPVCGARIVPVSTRARPEDRSKA